MSARPQRPYPAETAARIAARADARAALIAEAEGAAALFGMSTNCAIRTRYGTHPTDEPGCRNAGDGCLCPCHDR